MKGIILAGGFGTRLRPLTSHLPKPMVPILGRPMMEHVVNVVKDAGINDCVSLLYYQAETISGYFGDGSNFGVNMQYVQSQGDWGTAGAVKNAAGLVEDTVLVISGDVLTDFDLNEAVKFHKSKGAAVTIVLTKVEKPLAFGIVIIDPETGEIKRFLEKPAWGQVFSDTINTGIYVIEPHVLDYIPKGEEFDFSKNLFPLLMKKGEPLYGYVADGYWRDVGNLREYRRANEDGLSGAIKLEIPGKKIDDYGGKLYIGENVHIDGDIECEGTVLISDGTKVSAGARLKNSIIGANSKVGASSSIIGSVLWHDCEVGSGASIEHATIANDTIIGNEAMVGDYAVIADHCKIGDNAKIAEAVKIWPEKTVSPFASVNETLVWADRTGGELFSGSRASGIINSEISPEFASKLGAAFGASLGGKGSVLISRDGDRASQITTRALFCGIMSSGVDVDDVGIAPIPVVRWLLSKSQHNGGVHIRKSPRDDRGQDMIFFDGTGADLNTGQARSIERLFDREDFRRASYKDLGSLVRQRGNLQDYTQALREQIDRDVIARRGFRIVVDYSHGGTAEILPKILSDLKIDTVNVNAVIDPNRITRTREQREQDHRRLAIIVKNLSADAGFLLDPSGERLRIVDENGRLFDEQSELCIILDLITRTSHPKAVAVPISATMGVNKIAREKGVDLKFTRDDHFSMMESACSGIVDFVGGTRGGVIFPEWLFASDCIFATVKVLEMLAKSGQKLSSIASDIPTYMRDETAVNCSYELMGTLMRRLIEETANSPRDVIDGVKIYSADSWVLIIPGHDSPVFRIIGEAKTSDKLTESIEHYKNLLQKWILEA
ncbi:MAG: sugar phosphate nucleotidyltransferase [bacterium]